MWFSTDISADSWQLSFQAIPQPMPGRGSSEELQIDISLYQSSFLTKRKGQGEKRREIQLGGRRISSLSKKFSALSQNPSNPKVLAPFALHLIAQGLHPSFQHFGIDMERLKAQKFGPRATGSLVLKGKSSSPLFLPYFALYLSHTC